MIFTISEICEAHNVTRDQVWGVLRAKLMQADDEKGGVLFFSGESVAKLLELIRERSKRSKRGKAGSKSKYVRQDPPKGASA